MEKFVFFYFYAAILVLNFVSVFSVDYSVVVDCDWENSADECFGKVQTVIDAEKTLLMEEVEELHRRNDQYSEELNKDMANLNQRLSDLSTEMDNFQSEMQENFANMTEEKLFADVNKEIEQLESSGG